LWEDQAERAQWQKNSEEVRRLSKAPRDSANAAEAKIAFEILVNGDLTRLTGACSVAELLVSLDMGGRRVAVAVNRQIVVRSSYPDVQLATGDRIEILEAVGGG
jgi:sulfur carrier protein